MSYVFLPDAQEELLDAIQWYEREREGLGALLNEEVEGVIQRILQNPLLWRQRADGHRRVNCRAFPYYVAYHVRGQTVVIAAVGHVRRKPNYWKKRIDG